MKRGKQLFQKLLASILTLAMLLTGAVPQGISTVQAAGPEDGLILYYNFDIQNSFATDIPDASGNGNIGQMKKAAGGSAAGEYTLQKVNIFGKQVDAMGLPGAETGTYLQFPDGILKDCDAVTISAWVKLPTNTGYQRIWDFGNNNTEYMYLISDGGNEGFIGYSAAITKNGWDNEKGVSKGDNFNRNRWVLTTVVMDGSKMSLYLDGKQIGQTVDTGITVKDLGNSTQNYLGNTQFANGTTEGQFAEVKIYNKALSAQEIAAMYDVDDNKLVAADKDDLDLGDTTAVIKDFDLPTAGAYGSTITWTSQNPAIQIQDGTAKVTRPEAGKGNAVGTLKAELKCNGVTAEKTFDVTVVAQYTDQQVLDHDAESIPEQLGDLSAVVSRIDLPTKGEWGSVITWETTNPAVTIDKGAAKIRRPKPGSSNAVGKLKGTLSYGTTKKELEYDITVLAMHVAATITKVEPINVTTLKGKSPSLPNYVEVTYSDSTTDKLKTIWPDVITASNYAQAGTFTVEGSIVGEVNKITANVTVVDEQQAVKAVVSDSFDLSDISLDTFGEDGSILTQNRDRDLAYLKLLDNKRMLYNFYNTFGETDKIQGVESLYGWDEPTGLLRGHSTGHYISALSLAYASTGDTEIKAKLDNMVSELHRLQARSKGDPAAFKTKGVLTATWSKDPNEWGEGFVSGYSPDQFALLEQYTPYAGPDQGIWAPYYTLHKLIAGFLDSYTYAGNEEGLDAAKKLGKWVYRRLKDLPQEQLTKMWAMYIAGEYGGFNESLAKLYKYTKDEEFLEAAKLFDNTAFFDNMDKNVDSPEEDNKGIQGRHANQHIPQIIGALETYEATVEKGSPEVYYYNVAENFWQMVVSRYAYSIGGVGKGEAFTEPYKQAGNILTDRNCETCAAYNMLKLTKMLNNYNPDNAEYMDYYERTLYNQILASQTPNVTANMHNGTTYMLPIGPGVYRSYGGDYDSFSCCHGTGMENHVKYQEAAYAKTADTLYVGLYLPTTLTWEEKGVKVVQETAFPSETTKLTVSALEGKTPQSFNMKLRVPYWATNGFTVKLNGTEQNVDAEISTYVTLEGIKAGDSVEVTMPWTLHLDKTPDKLGESAVASVMYGPFVMAAQNASTDFRTLVLSSQLSDSIKIGEDETNGFPTLTSNRYHFAPMFAPEFASNPYHTYFKIIMNEDDGSDWYDIKIINNTPKYGSFDVNNTLVNEGEDLVITASPNEGYMVKSLTINGEAVQIGEDNTYTVSKVSEDLVVEGSFRLINPPTPDPEHLEFTAEASSDFTAEWETVDGPKNDWEPTASGAGYGRSWGNWPQAEGSEHYLQYNWDREVKMNRFDIFWYDDGGGTRIPGSLKIMYLAEDGSWKEANMLSKFEEILEINKYNTILFDEITTSAVKLVMTVREGAQANGISRWKVSGPKEDKPLEEADKAKLEKAINQAAALNKDNYTKESWSNLQTALKDARKVYNKEDASQEEVDNAAAKVNRAVKNLVAASAQPKAPESVKATWTGKKNIKVTWKKASKANKYVVYRSYKKTSGYKKIKTVTSTSYVDTKASAGKNVYYKVISYNGSVKGAASKPASAYMVAVPAKVKASAKNRNVTISMKRDAKATGYMIYRSAKNLKGFKKVAVVKAGKASTVKKTFKNLKKGTYYFKVKAYRTVNKKNIYTGYCNPVKVKVK